MTLSKRNYGRTKIVSTLGPSSDTAEVIGAMIRAGMDVARINFSHGTHDEHRKTLSMLQHAANTTGQPVSVILDLQGPKIRIGNLKTPSIILKRDAVVNITTKEVDGDEHLLSTTYQHFPKDVRKDDRVLLDDGKIELRVEAVHETEVELRVVVGGSLTAHKGINLPGVAVSAPSLTEKDKEDLQFAFEHNVDYVALSFVRRAHDVALLRDVIIEQGPAGRKISIIAKIEKGEAIDDIDAIIREADAVMVARGDLGVELHTEDVPFLQKMIVRKCNEVGKPVIIATQMLESMIENPTPTRAEASDVANAVVDGADAVMLSGETSVGKYPVQTVEVMERIIKKTEEQLLFPRRFDPDALPSTHPYDPLSKAACVLAVNLGATTIVALTHSGSTAIQIAKFRPHARIIAVTDREKIIRRLNLVWGIKSLIVEDLKKDTDQTFRTIRERLLEEGYVHAGETLVMLAGIPLFEGHPTNTIKVDYV